MRIMINEQADSTGVRWIEARWIDNDGFEQEQTFLRIDQLLDFLRDRYETPAVQRPLPLTIEQRLNRIESVLWPISTRKVEG